MAIKHAKTAVPDVDKVDCIDWNADHTGTINLNDLGDVNAAAPADNQALTWDAGTSKWIPETILGGVWTQVGNDIHYNLGKVAIGATFIQYPFEVTGTAAFSKEQGYGKERITLSTDVSAIGERPVGNLILSGVTNLTIETPRRSGKGIYLIYGGSAGRKSALEIVDVGVPYGNLVLMKSGGNVGIGTTTPGSKLAVVGLPIYANNAAAITGGLAAGDFYRTGADPDPVCVVH